MGLEDSYFPKGKSRCWDLKKGAWILKKQSRSPLRIILNLKENFGELELFFVIPSYESKGVGQAAWKEVERLHPEIKTWETVTPYFEQRNIHFYVNKLGFHIVEFYTKFLKDKDMPKGMDGMFRFQKIIK